MGFSEILVRSIMKEYDQTKKLKGFVSHTHIAIIS